MTMRVAREPRRLLQVNRSACIVVAAAAALAGCGSWSLKSDKIDYKSVVSQKPLDVPPDLSQLPRDDRFTVPNTASATAAQAAQRGQPGNVAGAQQVVAPASPQARIERDGPYRWLAVDMPPEAAYATVKEFWTSVGLAIERDDPKAGIVETAWAENRAKLPQDIIRRTIGRIADALYSTGEQDKFRTRIERTAKNTSEIYISHRGMVEVYTNPAQDTTRWQPRPPDTELEAEMLQRLLLRFQPQPAATQTAASAAPGAGAAAASTANMPPVARLVHGGDGRPERVEIAEPFDRAWRRVGLALDRGGFTVEDRDRTKGVYYVRYLDPESEAKQREAQGFLSKMFGNEPKIVAAQFRLSVEATSTASISSVKVLDKDGKPDTSPTRDKILAQLAEQLK
jgi:outer membrane protein assembly factor BamC